MPNELNRPQTLANFTNARKETLHNKKCIAAKNGSPHTLTAEGVAPYIPQPVVSPQHHTPREAKPAQ